MRQFSSGSVTGTADTEDEIERNAWSLVKKLKSALPDVRISVGRWAHPSMADESSQPLVDAGAALVASTLADTRKHLAEAAHIGTPVADVATPAA